MESLPHRFLSEGLSFKQSPKNSSFFQLLDLPSPWDLTVFYWIRDMWPVHQMGQKQSQDWTKCKMAEKCRLALCLRAKGDWFDEQLAIVCYIPPFLTWISVSHILCIYNKHLLPKRCISQGWSDNRKLSRIYNWKVFNTGKHMPGENARKERRANVRKHGCSLRQYRRGSGFGGDSHGCRWL